MGMMRPERCGECVRFYRRKITVNGIEYDGYCDEIPVPLMETDVCRPNVGVKARKTGKSGVAL